MSEALTELNIGGEEARSTKQKIERVWTTFIETQKQRIANEKLQEELQNAEKELKLLESINKNAGKNSQMAQKLAETKSRVAALREKVQDEDTIKEQARKGSKDRARKC